MKNQVPPRRGVREPTLGVTNAPFFWFVKSFSFVSSNEGRGVLTDSGMNMRLESMFLRFLGGKYIPFVARFCSRISRSMLADAASIEAFKQS